MTSRVKLSWTLLVALGAAGCGGASDRTEAGAANGGPDSAAGAVASCPAGTDTTLTLPQGFCAVIFADTIKGARHIAVASNGDVFVQRLVQQRELEGGSGKGGVVALRDANGDHRADTTAGFGETNGTGIGLHGGYLYADDVSRIVRFPLASGSLTPSGGAEVVVRNIPTGGHESRNFVFDSAGTMYMNIGSRTNSCQRQDRANGSPGVDPCTELQTRAGIWRFRADGTGQQPTVATRFATGNRNAMGLAINPANGQLYATQHGRDQLFQNWSAKFTAEQSASNPAEELQQVSAGDDFGWPYCYYSNEHRRRVLAPEYGGDGTEVGRCESKKAPVAAFPGHWAPMSLVFYTGTQFPPRYRGGAFIAFHGSWNRAPEPQAGYNVAFVPMSSGSSGSEHEVFASGFARDTTGLPGSAEHRPTGLAQGPDGALYLTDDRGGRIWKIIYVGARQ
jgi:glucose/arabinose dehydrogenase